MFATVASLPQHNFSIPKPTARVKATRSNPCLAPETGSKAANPEDANFRPIRRAISVAKIGRTTAKLDYKRVQFELDSCEKQMQLALKDDREDLAYAALCRQTFWQDKARRLKSSMDKYAVQVSTLQTQLGYWANCATTV